MASLRRVLAPTDEERREHPFTGGFWFAAAVAAWYLWRTCVAAVRLAETGSLGHVLSLLVCLAFLAYFCRSARNTVRRNLRTPDEIREDWRRQHLRRMRREAVRQNRRDARQRRRVLRNRTEQGEA